MAARWTATARPVSDVFAWVLVLAACAQAPEPAPVAETRQPPADLVLVLINGMRADQPGIPGPAAAFFATLGRPAAVSYDRAITQSVNSYASVVSLLTGRYPTAIPLCSWGLGATVAPWCVAIPEAAPTLPEVLGVYGYDTALIDVSSGMREHDFLVSEFGSAYTFADDAATWWSAHEAHPRLLVYLSDLTLPLAAAVPAARATGGDLAATLQAAYSTRLSSEASAVKTLLDRALSPGPRPAWAFVTSAHGLVLGETTGTPSLPVDPVQHDVILERTIHVPLAIYSSARSEPRRESAVVELLDLAPTFCRLGNAMPPAGLYGRELLSTKPDPTRIAYAEFGDMIAARSASHLLLARLWKHGGSTLDPEITERLLTAPPSSSSFSLHNVETDPMQTTERLLTEPAEALRLYQHMVEVRQGAGAPPDRGLTTEQVKALRETGALNYF
ncbi:hypothetical protein LBMAG42_46650 [Deltaproteobacteria bacterium]|nr:hypothetical protein LBMAG42_46650 [Deltaproteobacteria bacterium]